MAIFKHDFSVGFKDTGNSNVMTNKAFLSFMEDIGGMHSDEAGFGINDIEKTHLSWVLLGWKVHILQRPKYGEILTIKTWARNTEKFYTYRDFEAYNKEGQLVAIATSKWVLINIETGKLTKITEEIMKNYDPEKKCVFDDAELDKLAEPKEFISCYEYTVQRCNIDINKHMHNLYYLDLAYEALPEDVYEHATLNTIEIMYKKQVRLHDNLKCYYSFEDGNHIVTIKSEDDSSLHAIIRLS